MASLTRDQINGIVESWKTPAKDIFGSGEYILYQFFTRYPDNQEYFDKFRGVPLDNLKVRAELFETKPQTTSLNAILTPSFVVF